MQQIRTSTIVHHASTIATQVRRVYPLYVYMFIFWRFCASIKSTVLTVGKLPVLHGAETVSVILSSQHFSTSPAISAAFSITSAKESDGTETNSLNCLSVLISPTLEFLSPMGDKSALTIDASISL
jgi:hypothetical protein